MCNCGSRNQRMAATRIGALASGIPPRDPRLRAARSTVDFIDVGRTGLTAIGPATGIVYRFIDPKARMEVDARDASALAQVPVPREL